MLSILFISLGYAKVLSPEDNKADEISRQKYLKSIASSRKDLDELFSPTLEAPKNTLNDKLIPLQRSKKNSKSKRNFNDEKISSNKQIFGKDTYENQFTAQEKNSDSKPYEYEKSGKKELTEEKNSIIGQILNKENSKADSTKFGIQENAISKDSLANIIKSKNKKDKEIDIQVKKSLKSKAEAEKEKALNDNKALAAAFYLGTTDKDKEFVDFGVSKNRDIHDVVVSDKSASEKSKSVSLSSKDSSSNKKNESNEVSNVKSDKDSSKTSTIPSRETISSKDKEANPVVQSPSIRNISDILFKSSLMTKTGVLEKNESATLIENNNKIKSVIAQLQKILDANNVILKKFSDEKILESTTEENKNAPQEVLNYQVIEVTDEKK